MNGDVNSVEVSRIMHALATMPGSTSVNVTSKRFPRLGHNTYEERTRSFKTDAIPDCLALPANTEEILITVQGALPEPTPKSDLVEKLNDLFVTPGIAPQWDARARFTRCEADRQHYEVRVFTNGMFS